MYAIRSYYVHGGRKHMRLDAIEWAKTCESLGAGELCVNSYNFV